MKHGMMISLKEPVYRSLSWSTIQTQRITQQKQVLQQTKKFQRQLKMNKFLLLVGTILLVFLCAENTESLTFLQRVCKKCEYCIEDPTCDGCSKCDECFTGETKPDSKVSLFNSIVHGEFSEN